MLGNTLKLIRIANDMSVSFVSRGTQLKISLIESIENGDTKVSLSTLNIFSDFYKIPVSKILLLNDFHERFLVSEERMIEDIKNYYSLIEEVNKTEKKIIVKVRS